MRARLFVRRALKSTGARGTIGHMAKSRLASSNRLGPAASVQPALVAEIDHLLNERRLLLVVQRCKQRLGRVGYSALIDGTVVKELGFIAHLLDNIVGRVALGACDTQIQPIGPVVAEIVHCAVEACPMLLLLARWFHV